MVDGKIYVIGGAGVHPGSKETALHPARPHRSVDTNEVYDPATNTWETRQTMPTARNHAFVGVVNNKIYVIGGRVGNAFITRASNTGIVEEYDPATDQWGALKASMPNPRSAGGLGHVQGHDLHRRRRGTLRPDPGKGRSVRSRPTIPRRIAGRYCRI